MPCRGEKIPQDLPAKASLYQFPRNVPKFPITVNALFPCSRWTSSVRQNLAGGKERWHGIVLYTITKWDPRDLDTTVRSQHGEQASGLAKGKLVPARVDRVVHATNRRYA